MWTVHQLKSSVVKYIDVLAEWNIASHYITFSWLAFKWLARAWRLCQTQVNTHTRMSRRNAPRLPVCFCYFLKLRRFASAVFQTSGRGSFTSRISVSVSSWKRGVQGSEVTQTETLCENWQEGWRFLINSGAMRIGIFFKAAVFTLWM